MPSLPIRRSRLVLTSAVIAGLAGCQRQPATPTRAATSAPGLARSVGKSVTEAESRALADEFVAAAEDDDQEAFNRLIDWSAVEEAATAGIEAPAGARESFRKGIDSREVGENGVSYQVMKAVRGGGSYALLHDHVKDGRRWLLFRLLSPEGVNYHDIPIARREDGKVRGVDVYVYLDSELQSQRLHRLWIQLVTKFFGGVLTRLSGEDQDLARYFDRMVALNLARKDGHFGEVLRIYHDAAPEVQKDKSALRIRLEAAARTDNDAEYLATLNDLLTLFPDDSSADLFAIDVHLRKRRFAEALACVDRVDRAVLGDPYLHNLRAGIHQEQGDLAAARTDAERAIAEAPDMSDGYWSLVSIDLQAKDHAATLRDLRIIRDRFHPEFGDLAQQETYKPFTQSPEYQEWLRHDATPDPVSTPPTPVADPKSGAPGPTTKPTG